MNLETTWDFVARYYPNYSRCNAIAESNDLEVIIDGEVEDDSCAADMYRTIAEDLEIGLKEGHNFDDEDVIEEAERRLVGTNMCIFEAAIEGYLETLKN